MSTPPPPPGAFILKNVWRDRSFLFSEVKQVRMKVIQCYDHAEPEQMDTFYI